MGNTAVKVVELSGSLDIHTIGDFENALSELFKKGHYKIVLNLENLTYISSSGFGVLLGVIKEIRKHRGDMKITNLSPDIYKLFEVMELPIYFQILNNEKEAVNAF